MAEAIPTEWEVVPGVAGSAEAGLQAIAQRCRRKVTKNALFAAGVAVVSVSGIDWLTDLGVLIRLLPQINAEFGLTPEQIVESAVEENADVIGASVLSGSHLELADQLMDGLRQAGAADDVVVVFGGIIPRDDFAALKAKGIARVFTTDEYLQPVSK